MAETVGCSRELNWDERFAQPRRIDSPAASEEVIHQRLTDKEWQELMQNQPLVVPRGQPPSTDECFRVVLCAGMFGAKHVHDSVVEEQYRSLGSGEQRVP